MEISQRKPEDMISETLIEQLTESINKTILEKLKAKFPYEYWEPNKRKLFEEKFDIKSSSDKEIPYNIQWFIYQKIEEDIHNGYIEHTYKDDNGKLHTQKINLDKLEKVIYVYDPLYDNKSIIRIHKYKSDNNFNEPIYVPYITDNKIQTYGNFNNSILGFIPNMKYIEKFKYYDYTSD